MSKVNEISVLRKRVITNIPGFDDDETGKNQNEWFKLYDFTCVDIAPGMTARVYNLEDTPENDNNDTQYYIEFHFESVRQSNVPPYDLNEGDYVAFYQGGERHFIRIVKIITVQLFQGGCCVFQLICNVTNPRKIERLQGCGITSIIPDEELAESEGESE
jgi:hypothetical protein